MSIDIENVGPIERIALPIPEDGGVVIFRGRNGTGKSTALDSIDVAVSGRGRLPVRDGAVCGSVKAHGVTLTIGRSVRRNGEAEVECLEGKLSIADLVEPPIKDPQAADAHRLRALLSLVNAKPNIEMFTDLADGVELTPETRSSDDLVTMASRVKRDLEVVARASEGAAENAERDEDAARRAAEGLDVAWAQPQVQVQLALEHAVEERAALRSRAESRQAAADAATAARGELAEAESLYKGPSAGDAQARVVSSNESLELAHEALAAAQKEYELAAQAFRGAKDYERMRDQWQAAIEAAPAELVSSDELAAAEDLVQKSRETVDFAARGRQAVELAAEQEDAKSNRVAAQSRADTLRTAARGTDDVLTTALARTGVPLSVKIVNHKMRLCVETGRGTTPYSELSPGERWRIALDIACVALGPGGELTIRQHAWEALDPDNQAAIAAQVKLHGIIAYTAEATDGDLRAEPFQPNGAHEIDPANEEKLAEAAT